MTDYEMKEDLRTYFGADDRPDSILDAMERRVLRVAMGRAHGNQSRAARFLGVTRYALRYRLEKHGLTTAVLVKEWSEETYERYSPAPCAPGLPPSRDG